MKKGLMKKTVPGFLKICKYISFNIWKSGQAKKLHKFFLRFLSMPFGLFEKGDKHKIYSGIS